MIIVEGPDGSGKTMLTNMLHISRVVDSVLPSPRIAGKGNLERMKYEMARYIKLHGSNHRIVVDRFLFSEIVYGPILRGKSTVSKAEYLSTLLGFLMNGSIVIFCDPDTLNFKKDENPKVIEKAAEIQAAYRACAEDLALVTPRVFIYKWDEAGSTDRVIEFIRRYQ